MDFNHSYRLLFRLQLFLIFKSPWKKGDSKILRLFLKLSYLLFQSLPIPGLLQKSRGGFLQQKSFFFCIFLMIQKSYLVVLFLFMQKSKDGRFCLRCLRVCEVLRVSITASLSSGTFAHLQIVSCLRYSMP